MAQHIPITRPDGSVQLVRSILETPAEEPLTPHGEIINELVAKEPPLTELEGIRVGSVTLVGYLKTDYPMESGNCFNLGTKDTFYHVVNFKYENFEKLLKDKVTEFPVKMLKLSDRQVVLHDSRIPDDWYTKDFCTICCPDTLLPLPQRLITMRAIERGDIRVITKDGKVFHTRKVGATARKLKSNWTMEAKD